MYHDARRLVTNSVGEFLKAGDYSMRGLGKALSQSSDELQLLVSGMIPVDPIDPGEMALANRSYADRAYSRGLNCMLTLNASRISDLTEIVRAQGLIVHKLEMNDHILLSLVENVVNGRQNIVSNLADLGSSSLRGAASALWTLPGINVTFGLAAFAAGTLLEWYSKKSSQDRLCEDLGMARHLLLENAVPIAIYDGIDNSLKNNDDVEGQKETVLDWIDTREKVQYSNEIATFSEDLLRNDILFLGCYDDPYQVGVMFPVIRNTSCVVFIGVIDLRTKLVSKDYISIRNMKINFIIEHYVTHMMCGSSKQGRAFLASRTPKMAPDDILERRFTELEKFLCNVEGTPEAQRSLLHAFVQSGAIV